ncbi:MAG: hypothetical protein J6J79_10120 [Lachnospiraceae bacterium]|nr:hypothetical protein [Lachnospiraceae bacterium]
MKKINWKYIKVGYFLLAAFLIILFASRSSFLYPCNNWNDANSYFSVGKALFNGKVPYRDVFDQKGMYLYFFYGLAYLVSHTTFAGVFLMEVILATFDIAGICKILKLFVKEKTALILTPMVLAVSFASYSFYWGGCAEEVCLPFIIWGLYFSLAYFKNDYPDKEMPKRTLFIGGLLAGMVANIKFTSLGFFFAWMMCVAFSFLVKKNFFGAVKACLIFLAGMLIPFVPWFIYFAIHNALYYWYWGYVWVNVFAYSNLNNEGPSLFERIYILAKILYWLIIQNFGYFVFIIPGVLAFFFGKGKKILERFNILALCFFLFIGIYIGGLQLPYYALPLSVFAVLGFALLGRIIEWILKKTGMVFLKKSAVLVTLSFLSIVVSTCFIYFTSMNTPFMKEKREDMFLYKFKEIVEQEENPTLLNISCLDAGLYTVCDIVPTCQWFQTQTVIMETVLGEQERYIREGLISFIIARDEYPQAIWERYELVAQEPWYHEGTEFTYYLFKRKE